MKSLCHLVFFSLLVLSLSREGSSTHLETCDCHEIKDVVNATVQDAIAVLEEKMNILISKSNEKTSSDLESVLSATIEKLLRPIKAQLDYHLPSTLSGLGNSQDNPVASCKALKELNPYAVSGYYWVKDGEDISPIHVYCNMSLTCGGLTGGWMKVADLDMRNTSQSCPSGLTLTTSPKRVCGITNNGCVSNSYSVHDMQYSHVCGRVIGYHFRTPVAFHYSGAYTHQYDDIDQPYIYGVSLTHGRANHRSHIWSFAGSSDETTNYPYYKCPCINTNIPPPTTPSFVGNDYFCDTALNIDYTTYSGPRLISDDPLWDGEGCGPTNACCNFPSSQVKPPWFYKHLSQSTTDDIEMRVCRSDSTGSTPIEIVELYVQ